MGGWRGKRLNTTIEPFCMGMPSDVIEYAVVEDISLPCFRLLDHRQQENKKFNCKNPPGFTLISANIIYNQMTTVRGGIQVRVYDVCCAVKDSSI